MKELWDFYENMNELVYVADMDTYELVYMNRKAREAHDIPSIETLSGQLCYKVLQGCSSPCAMCTNNKLTPGEFYEWKYYNPRLGKTYALKDTMLLKDGKRYRMELTIDISTQEQQKQAIKDFTTNEALVNEGLRQALSADTPEMSLEVLMQYLGQALECDRVYIFEERPGQVFDNTYEWCKEGVIPQKENLQAVPFEAVEIWYRSFNENQSVIIKDLEQVKETDPLQYEYLAPQDIHTLVVSPLFFHKEIIGFYGVDNPPPEHLNHISVMFQVLGHFFSSILKRRDLVKRLENLSYYDQLTGAKNRHGMDEFIANVQADQSLAVIYCDVLGLKKINDSKGHQAGDTLLIHAYECLLKHFPSDSIFRVGGDEFIVLYSGISEEDMLNRIQDLRDDMPLFNVAMSLGYIWQEKCNGHINDWIRVADNLMYEEKRKYYAAHPDTIYTK